MLIARAVYAVSVLAGLSACSASPGNSEYGCPGMPAGVVCQDTRTAYHATSSADHIASPESIEDQTPVAPAGSVPAQVIANPDTFRQGETMVPIRTPAIVMRVWIAPWVSEGGDLMLPGYVMTEIEPRRWQLGHQEPPAYDAGFLQPIVPTPSAGTGAGIRSRTLPPPGSAGTGTTVERGTGTTIPAGTGRTTPPTGGTQARPPGATGGSTDSGRPPAGSSALEPSEVSEQARAYIPTNGRQRGRPDRPSRTFISGLTGQPRTIEYVYPESSR